MLGIKESELLLPEGESWIGPAPWIETPPPGPKARLLVERDKRCTSPSYTREYPLVAKRAHGSVVEDVDGNRYLDFAAGIAVCSTGHTHPKVVTAIQKQAAELIHICGSDFYYPPMIEVCEKLCRITPGDFPKRVFLTNSGTEATECTIKMVRRHTRRKYLIAFHGAFHGRTTGALALTSSKAKQKAGFGPLLPMVAKAPYGDVDYIRRRLFRHEMEPTEVAAIFVEAVQGEGGYVVAPDGFLAELRALCDEHGIMLVADEIQSGMGRTGKWFAVDHFDVVPDVVLIAKGVASGLPLGAVVARETLMDWPPGAQGSTFGGNPVSCAAALATIELIESHYMQNAAKLGVILRQRLGQIADQSRILSHIRGLGLMVGVDVVNRETRTPEPRVRDKVILEAFSRGVILLPCGECGIRFAPPLCMNETQLDVGMDVLDEVVDTVAAGLNDE